jgi:hypothetical protein
VDSHDFTAIKGGARRTISVKLSALLLESPGGARVEAKVLAVSAAKGEVFFMVEIPEAAK